MEGVARAWLPKGAFSLEAVGGCLAGPLAAWSGRWFARAAAAVAAVRSGEALSHEPAPHGAVKEGTHAALEMPGRGKRRLLEAALDIDLSELALAEADRRVLDAFAETILADLAVTLDEALAGGEGSSDARIVATVTLGRIDILTLAVAQDALVPLIKKSAAPPQPAQRPLERRSDAIKKTRLDLHGFLGRAEIGLHELKELGVGDVLVLDRPLAEPVELRLGTGTLARGRLCQDKTQFSIQL